MSRVTSGRGLATQPEEYCKSTTLSRDKITPLECNAINLKKKNTDNYSRGELLL